MATAEASPSTLGPRYAPDDPTLPKPWKGLIDGSTGLLYYWNPETNVTQYEKPPPSQPPLPPGPPPAASTSKLNPLLASKSSQPDSIQSLQNQQLMQNQPTQAMLMGPTLQQQTQVVPQAVQQQVALPGHLQGSHLGPALQQAPTLEESMHQTVLQTGQQGQPLLAQIHIESGQQGLLQPMQQIPMQPGHQASYQPMPHVQHGQIYPGTQMGTSHGFQFTQHMQYMVHQQGPQSSSQLSQHLNQRQQMSHQQNHKVELGPRDDIDYNPQKQVSPSHQHLMQGQQFLHPQEPKTGIPQRDDLEFQPVNQTGFSPAQIQQTGTPSVQNLPVGSNSSHAQNMNIQPNLTMHYGGSSANMQHNDPSVQGQQKRAELTHPQYGSGFQTQIGPGTMHGQQQNLPPPGSQMQFEESHTRAKSEYFYNTTKDANVFPHQLPKLAPLPMTRNQQEVRISEFPSQNAPPNLPGSVNGSGGPFLHGVYAHSSGAPSYPSNASVRPPLAMARSSDPIHSSAAEIYRQKHEVTTTGEDVPAPFMTFEATGFPSEILQEIHFAGFSAPTPIQAQTWPIALQNRDVVAIAKTGSGKTLGYLIPAFIHIRRRHNNPRNGPTVLVLAPTRELATQIQDEAIKFGRSSRVSCTCLYGGAPKGPQLKELDRGADIVVATPGRLNDILEMKRIDFRQVSLLVLDEADRMLDMGFEPQIRKIVNEIPPRRQTLMYTATWPKEVRKIASDLLFNPVQVNIGSVDELAANKSITQYVEVVPELEKQRRLEQILRSQERGSKVIIFCSTKKLCDQLARNLGRNFGAAAIHGDKSQGERDWVLNQFRMGKAPVLVATDVAARGLDIRDIRVVINYDFPTGIEDYVHRIGRTGRAGATGLSYTFFSEQDWKYAPDLVKVLEGANQVVPPEIRDIAARGGPTFGKDRGAMSRYDSADSGGRWDSGSRGGMKDGAFGGCGGARDAGFVGRGGMRDGGIGGRGGMRDGGFGGRGGMRDGGRGRGRGRDGGFSRPSGGGRIGWERGGRGPYDRFNNLDARGQGRGRGRGRFDSRRDSSDRSRARSFSPSPERVRTWGYSRSQSRSRSRSWSRDRSYSRSRSRSRSWSSRSRSRSPRRSRSWSRSRSRSRSSYERRPRRRQTKFDQMEVPAIVGGVPEESGRLRMSPGSRGHGVSGNEPAAAPEQVPCVAKVDLSEEAETGAAADPNIPLPSEP